MLSLWQPFRLGGLTLPGRIVCTAVAESLCTPEGAALPALRDHYALLGRGGAIGLMIMGFMLVAEDGRKRARQAALTTKNTIPGFRRVTEAARRDGSKIFAQLNHAGIVAEESVTGQAPKGPSPLPEAYVQRGPLATPGRAMSEEEILLVVNAFATAAARAREAGFDGVQVQAAHGFLLNQFLSPLFNRREDAWGSNNEGRTRIVRQIIAAIRTACGEDFPIIAKVNGSDLMEGGLTLEMTREQVRLFQQAGLDGVEVSGGNCVFSPVCKSPFQKPQVQDANGGQFFASAARSIQEAVSIPVISVGGIRHREQAERIAAHPTSLVGLCRPLIRDPLLALQWREGHAAPSDCISCNGCLIESRDLRGVRCVKPL